MDSGDFFRKESEICSEVFLEIPQGVSFRNLDYFLGIPSGTNDEVSQKFLCGLSHAFN